MKKIKEKNKSHTIKILFLGVLAIVLIVALYLMSVSSGILLSPDEGISFESAKSYIIGLGPNGVDWFCGKKEFYTDTNGKQYGAKSLEELKRILGNEMRLISALCSS